MVAMTARILVVDDDTALAEMIGIVLRMGSGAEALAWGVMFVVLPLSGVFYPVDALPPVQAASPALARQ